MKRLTVYILASFAAVTVFAEEIDAEIIQHLDFFEKMPVVEELDLIEPAGAETDSLDDEIQGEGQ